MKMKIISLLFISLLVFSTTSFLRGMESEEMRLASGLKHLENICKLEENANELSEYATLKELRCKRNKLATSVVALKGAYIAEKVISYVRFGSIDIGILKLLYFLGTKVCRKGERLLIKCGKLKDVIHEKKMNAVRSATSIRTSESLVALNWIEKGTDELIEVVKSLTDNLLDRMRGVSSLYSDLVDLNMYEDSCTLSACDQTEVRFVKKSSGSKEQGNVKTSFMIKVFDVALKIDAETEKASSKSMEYYS